MTIYFYSEKEIISDINLFHAAVCFLYLLENIKKHWQNHGFLMNSGGVEINVFLLFPGSIESDQWHEMV